MGDSGEISPAQMILSALTEIRSDQREFRTRVEAKLDQQATEIKEIMVMLSDGKGRMDVMQQSIQSVRETGEINDRRLQSIERGSDIHPAVKEEKEGGWISAKQLPAIIAAIASLVATIMASMAFMRAPAVATTAAAPTTTTQQGP